jgi:outer membrane protein insertion porin family
MQRIQPSILRHMLSAALAIAACNLVGCQHPLFKSESDSGGLFGKNQDLGSLISDSSTDVPPNSSLKDRLEILGIAPAPPHSSVGSDAQELTSRRSSNGLTTPTDSPMESTNSTVLIRAQSPDVDSNQNSFQVSQAVGNQDKENGKVVQAQYPENVIPGELPIGNGLASPNIGSPNESNPLIQPYERGGVASDWTPDSYFERADVDVYVTETQTGRFNFGGAYNSENGIVGQFTIDEKNFDITRWPRNFGEIIDGKAWRGGGQTFRLELVPGANLERYLVSITEPNLLGSDISFSASAYLYDRNYYDWDEHRAGGKFSIGRRLTPYLSINSGVRLESVTVDNPRLDTSTELNNSLGTSNLYIGNVGIVRDTRDSVVQATTGSLFSMNYSQAFGDYSYSRGDLDLKTYRLLYQRPDGSGRHTVSFGTKLGFTGNSTPIFENYFAGGFSTLRGFDFRGASPLQGGVRVGGEFQWLNTVEYTFPLTASDNVKGVLFCDYGTVEEDIEITADNFRVAPGFGFRLSMPGAGIGAPLAFDFAFPVASAEGDDEKIFSFYLGVLR